MAVTDASNQIPPITGSAATFDYNLFKPGAAGFPAKGGTYVDPKFGSTIIRLTDIGAAAATDNQYGHCNGNADGTRYYGRITGISSAAWINTSTAATVASGLTEGTNAGGDDMTHPTDPGKYFFIIASGASRGIWEGEVGVGETRIKNFGANIQTLGSTQNWCDRTGEYFLFRDAGGVGVWRRSDDMTYTNRVPMGNYMGISPDGAYIHSGDDDHIVYSINHGTATVNTTGVNIWPVATTFGGDHACAVVGQDGINYLIGLSSATGGNQQGLYRITMDRNRAALSGNACTTDTGVTKILTFLNADIDGIHLSTPSAGATSRDWVFVSSEATVSSDDSRDDFDEVPDVDNNWHAGKSEIIAYNFITGEIRRSAHTRSRGLHDTGAAPYNCQPRVSCSWGGEMAFFASNMNDGSPVGYSDIYGIVDPLGLDEGGGGSGSLALFRL